MKISKMAYDWWMKSGQHFNLDMLYGRYSGDTTGYVLSFIGNCLQHPDKKFIVNHGQGYISKNFTLREIEQVIHKLGLQYFEVRKNELSVIYKPFVTVEKVTTWVVVND